MGSKYYTNNNRGYSTNNNYSGDGSIGSIGCAVFCFFILLLSVLVMNYTNTNEKSLNNTKQDKKQTAQQLKANKTNTNVENTKTNIKEKDNKNIDIPKTIPSNSVENTKQNLVKKNQDEESLIIKNSKIIIPQKEGKKYENFDFKNTLPFYNNSKYAHYHQNLQDKPSVNQQAENDLLNKRDFMLTKIREIENLKSSYKKRTNELMKMSENELIYEYNEIQRKKNLILSDLKDGSISHNFEVSFFVKQAIEKDYPNLLLELLKNGFKPDNWTYNNNPTIFYAADNDSRKCIKVLVDHGVDLKVKSDHEIVRLLFFKTSKLKNKGRTLLHTAAQKGNIYLAEKVIAAGIPVDKTTDTGLTPIYYAIKNNQYEMAAFLINKGAKIDEKTKSKIDDPKMLDIIEKKDFSISAFDESKEENNDTDSNKSNVSDSPENKEWKEAFEYIKNGKLFDLYQLYTNGKDLSKMSYEGMPAPCIAAKYNQLEIMKFLINPYDCKELVDSEYGRSALHYAAINSNRNMLNLLLNNGFDINFKDKKGNTPLHYAIEKSATNCVEMLINNGANINTPNIKQQTPLHLAVLHDYPYYAKILLEKGANMNLQDENGNTALHYLALFSSTGSSRILDEFSNYKYKFDLDIKNNEGKTPRNICENDCFALFENNNQKKE